MKDSTPQFEVVSKITWSGWYLKQVGSDLKTHILVKLERHKARCKDVQSLVTTSISVLHSEVY